MAPPEGTGSAAPSIGNDGSCKAAKSNTPVENWVKIQEDVLKTIGQTPMVKLNRIPQSFGVECAVYGKCEYLNCGGSYKDRVALRMVEEAERDGRLKPGYTVIEPTSGNTGVGLAMVCAVKGYNCILVMPEKMSSEKHNTMARLGAKVVRTPKTVKHTTVAYQLQEATPNSVILDQYSNPSNPFVHYQDTAEEIIQQCGGDIDMVVMGVGTGGAISGVGKKIKEKIPSCLIVGVDPEGSMMALPEKLNKSSVDFWEVEGIGHDWIPDVLDQSVIDTWVKCTDKQTFNMARRLLSEEGLLVGGSSGSAMIGAIKAIKACGLKKEQKCVILFPDSIRNYMTKFMSDQWMLERGLIEDDPVTQSYSWWNKTVSEIMKPNSLITVKGTDSLKEAVKLLKKNSTSQLAVIDSQGNLEGVVSLDAVNKKMSTDLLCPTSKVNEVSSHQFKRVHLDDTLGHLSYVLQASPFAIVVDSKKVVEDGKKKEIERPLGALSQIDLVDYAFGN